MNKSINYKSKYYIQSNDVATPFDGQLWYRKSDDTWRYFDGVTSKDLVSGIDLDEKVRISASDTVSGYIDDKLVYGGGITSINSAPGDQQKSIYLTDTGVTPGAYTGADITIDANGRITAASSGGGGVDEKIKVSVDDTTAGYAEQKISADNVNIGTLTQNPAGNEQLKFSLLQTTVAAGNYTSADITVDAYGRITAASSGASPSLRNVTATDTFATASETINCEPLGTSGTYIVNLPTAVGIQGTVYTLVNSGTGVITLDANGTETINGSLTINLAQYTSRTVQSDGANWIII